MASIRNLFESCLLVAALMIFCLFVAYALPEGKNGMAAWAQAIGSVAAIFAAIKIADNQAKREEKTRAELVERAAAERRYSEYRIELGLAQRLDDVATTLWLLVQTFENAAEKHKNGIPYTFIPMEYENILARISELDKVEFNHIRLRNIAHCRSLFFYAYAVMSDPKGNLPPEITFDVFAEKCSWDAGQILNNTTEHWAWYVDNPPPNPK